VFERVVVSSSSILCIVEQGRACWTEGIEEEEFLSVGTSSKVTELN
jgi:hypothetical protein